MSDLKPRFPYLWAIEHRKKRSVESGMKSSERKEAATESRGQIVKAQSSTS